ncbi:MAG: DUF1833 family protein [Thermodesulfobacteriota bacterium]
MPRDLSAVVTEEKNQPASIYPWLLALEITVPGLSAPIRVARNNEDITWRGETWTGLWFDFGEVTEEKKGEASRLDLRVVNVDRIVETYVHDWDEYCKANGYESIEFTLYLLNAKDLANDDPVAEHSFLLGQPPRTST